MTSGQSSDKEGAQTRADSAYEGKAGKTRTESAHVVMRDGSLRSVELYRTVNVATHPELRERALNGELHRLEDGRELRLPFVYHDPEARKFVLVVPGELSHLELKERAGLMNELAEDREHPVPPYVRGCTTVIGLEALRVFLAAPAFADEVGLSLLPPKRRAKEIHARREVLAKRERDLAQQEQDLTAILEGIAGREDEIRERLGRLEAEQRDLVIRVEAMEKRLDAHLKGGYEAAAERAASAPAVLPDGEWREVASDTRDSVDSVFPAEIVGKERDSIESGDRPSESELSAQEVTEQELKEVEVAAAVVPSQAPEAPLIPPPPLRLGFGASPPPLTPHAVSTGGLFYEYPQTMVVTSDQVEMQPPPLPRSQVVQVDSDTAAEPDMTDQAVLESEPEPPPLPLVRPAQLALATADGSEVQQVPRPEIDPPLQFFSSENVQMSACMDREPWLFVRVDPEHRNAFGDQSDLLAQYLEVKGYPVVVLVLVDDQQAGSYVRRAALDPYAPEDRRFLAALERSFSARVAIYQGHDYLETREVSAFREKLAREILGLTLTPRDDADISASDALKLVLLDPPELRPEGLPFGPPSSKKAGLGVVADAVKNLAAWTTPEQLAKARLLYSVPDHVIEASVKRILRAALKFGIALPESLRESAIRLGVAADPAAMIAEQLREFASRRERAAAELGLEATAANWRQLLEAADRYKLPVDQTIRQLAAQAEALAASRPLG